MSDLAIAVISAVTCMAAVIAIIPTASTNGWTWASEGWRTEIGGEERQFPSMLQLAVSALVAGAVAVAAASAESPHLAALAVPSGVVSASDLAVRRIPYPISGPAGLAVVFSAIVAFLGGGWIWGLPIGAAAMTLALLPAAIDAHRPWRAVALAAPLLLAGAGTVVVLADGPTQEAQGAMLAGALAAAVGLVALSAAWLYTRMGQEVPFGGGDIAWAPLCMMAVASSSSEHWIGNVLMFAWAGFLSAAIGLLWELVTRIQKPPVREDISDEETGPRPWSRFAPAGPIVALGAAAAAPLPVL